MKIAIVGLGLIGGSLAIDLRSKKIATRLIGIDFNEGHARKALELGLVDEILTEERAFAESDVVILAIPVNTIGALLPSILDRIAKNTVVIDTGSTKTMICKSVTQHNRRTQFVAAHPISGTENSGPTAALKGLFEGKTNIICEKEQSSDSSLAVAKMIFDSVGMNTIFMEPDEHDKHVAYVSHLSHVSSFLLGQTVLDIEKDEKNIF
ncbi:MAG: prephenate dehydrogenase/arogenate dehydrogenase family protein, partial [Cytophagales bacterium]|nr:prephenate dehydrogenase/arogenate dehydrogenase family protein [Cytophagales bacterium]